MLFEQKVDRVEPVGDAFGVVDAIDADAEEVWSWIEGPGPLRQFRLNFTALCRLAACCSKSMLIGNGRTDRLCPSRTTTWTVLEVDQSFQVPVDGVEEVLAVVAEVEAEQIVAQQAVEQFLLPRKRPERLAVRPGNMPELRDDKIRIIASSTSAAAGRSGSPE